MRKNYAILALAAAALLAGCQKEEFAVPSAGTTTLTVSLSDTKTQLGEAEGGVRKVYWVAGDQLAVNGVASDALALEAPAESASFTFQSVLEQPYSMLYPAGIWKDATTVTLPLNARYIPMAGYTTVENGGINAVESAVKITLKAGTTAYNTVSYVEVSAADSRQLSGDFTIDYQAGTLTSTSSTAAADKLVRVTVNAELTAEGVSVIVPLPAGEYGINVKIVDAQGHYMTKATTGAKQFKNGSIIALPAIAFEPTATEIGVTITSADEWNAFAKAYNNGDYDLQRPLIIDINADLDFAGKELTTAGSYADTKYIEYAYVNGNNHKISNLKASDVLIGTIGYGAELKDLTMDETCAFTPAYDGTTQKHFGPFTEYVKGTIKNCVNKGSITISGTGVKNEANLYVGGIAGRVREGSISGCENYGRIESLSSYTANAKALSTGGIVGYISNTDGVVSNCTNHGEIVCGGITDPLYCGGIAGVSSGIVEKCTNDAVVSNNQVRESEDPAKNFYLGGIVGVNANGGTIQGCTSKGSIKSTSSIKIFYAGGICARANGGTIKENVSECDITSTAGIRQVIFGGLVGSIEGYDTDLNLDGSSVKSKITVSGMESGSAVYAFIGGILGRTNGGKATLKGTEFDVPVDITLDMSQSAWTAAEVWLGGVAGGTMTTGTYDIDGFKTTFPENGGITVVYSTANTSNPVVMGAGGILGGSKAGATIQNCTATCPVKCKDDVACKKSNGKIVDFGGIAGRITGGDTKIINCATATSTSTRSYHYNNNNVTTTTGNCTGGIIGSFGHEDGNTFTIEIKDCKAAQKIYSYRGAAGGIGGYLSNATVTNCSYTGQFTNSNIAGGIVGYAVKSSFSGCTYKNANGITSVNAGSCLNYAGGIAGYTVECALDSCNASFGNISAGGAAGSGNAPGAIIGYSDEATKIGTTTACAASGKLTAANYTVEDGVSMADGIDLTSGNILTYAVGNKGVAVTADQVKLLVTE